LSGKWEKPLDEFVKMISDGAVNMDSNNSSSGFLARDGNTFRGAAGKFYEGISDPLRLR
jgi:hypothetical protein